MLVAVSPVAELDIDPRLVSEVWFAIDNGNIRALFSIISGHAQTQQSGHG
jgi:hypothetical protein